MFKIIIAGGRDFNNYNFLKTTIDKLLKYKNPSEILIISGLAKGADTLGLRYAKEKGYKVVEYPANWNLYGKAAGPIRNEEMAKNANALVAFWNGKSKGTKNMIELAKKYNLEIRVISYK